MSKRKAFTIAVEGKAEQTTTLAGGSGWLTIDGTNRTVVSTALPWGKAKRLRPGDTVRVTIEVIPAGSEVTHD